MSSSLQTKTPNSFVCDCNKWARSACEGEPFFKEHKGKRFCVLHFPGKSKIPLFNESLKKKLAAGNYNFSGVWFPDGLSLTQFSFDSYADFNRANFLGPVYFHQVTFNSIVDFAYAKFSEEVNFMGCKYNGEARFFEPTFKASATFGSNHFNKLAEFTQAKFEADVFFGGSKFDEKADFFSAKFDGDADFINVRFDGEANFDAASFQKQASFLWTTFNKDAVFTRVTFSAQVHFDLATFKDFVRFSCAEQKPTFSAESSLSLEHSKLEKADRFSFHTLTLRPHWFVNVDARKFEFINVNWNWRDISTKQEIKSISEEADLSAHRLLAITCRNLAVNAEENHRYEEASRFRYMAMEARRLERWRGFAFWTLGWWYWVASGYGERVWRAFVVLIGIWLLAAALYTGVGFARWETRVTNEREAVEARRDEVGAPLGWPRALTYSLGVMTLQKPEPRPATNAAQSLVMLETILGPVQAALLALAIRRKFMR